MSDKYLLLLRGLIRGKRHWGPSMKLFEENFPDYKILTYDIAGNGSRYQGNSFTSIEENVEDLRTRLKSEVPSGAKVHIIALSLGGMIALHWIQTYKDDFSSAVLINTSFRGLTPFHQRLRPKALFNFIRIALTLDLGKREKIIYSVVSSMDEKTELIDLWAKLARENPISRVNAIKQILAAVRFKPNITHKLPIPAHVLTGGADRLCNSISSDHISKAWNLTIERKDDAGHELQSDAPDWFFEKLAKWLQIRH